jgi:hypothetical protein
MTDSELLNYCDLHCETERALFSGEHVNRMIALAGYPDNFVHSINPQEWVSLHDDMKDLCSMARDRLEWEKKNAYSDDLVVVTTLSKADKTNVIPFIRK